MSTAVIHVLLDDMDEAAARVIFNDECELYVCAVLHINANIAAQFELVIKQKDLL